MRGNHDTNRKIGDITCLPNVVECYKWADVIKHKKHEFYLSHHPTLCANMRESMPRLLNLHGHTHSPDRFQFFEHGCYNVAMDAHNCYPVLLDNIRPEFKQEMERRAKLANIT
jgi:calcineurin-like phosphoesterase family protein